MANGKEEMRDQGCKECLIRGKQDKNGKSCNFRDKIKDKMPRTFSKMFALVEILLMPLSGSLWVSEGVEEAFPVSVDPLLEAPEL